MLRRARFVSLGVSVLCACPGNPLEGGSASDGSDSSSGTSASESVSSSATLTGNTSATMGSNSADGSSGPTDPSTTDPMTTDSVTTDPSATDPTADASTTDPTNGTTTDPSQGTSTDPTNGTTTDGTTTGGTTTDATSSGGEGCDGDEAELHQDPLTAIPLDGLDCDDAAGNGAGVLDAATWQDWWSFPGTDAGTCEPDAVGVHVTSGGPLPVCAYTQIGCTRTCTMGSDDDTGLGCCGIDQVQLSVECGTDDSSGVWLLFGDGTELCHAFTFDYEF